MNVEAKLMQEIENHRAFLTNADADADGDGPWVPTADEGADGLVQVKAFQLSGLVDGGLADEDVGHARTLLREMMALIDMRLAVSCNLWADDCHGRHRIGDHPARPSSIRSDPARATFQCPVAGVVCAVLWI